MAKKPAKGQIKVKIDNPGDTVEFGIVEWPADDWAPVIEADATGPAVITFVLLDKAGNVLASKVLFDNTERIDG